MYVNLKSENLKSHFIDIIKDSKMPISSNNNIKLCVFTSLDAFSCPLPQVEKFFGNELQSLWMPESQLQASHHVLHSRLLR